MMHKTVVEIYTDGACSGNPGPGGWGVLLKFGDATKTISGYSLETTNNKMEILAAIEALKAVKKTCNIKIYTDSRYLQQGITQWVHNWKKNNWKNSRKEPVKNADLWQELLKQLQGHDNVSWVWVKAHSDNEGNNIADRLAVEARDVAIRKVKCHS